MITMTHAISRRCRQALAGVVLGAASMAAPQAATLDDTLGLGLGGLDPLALGGGSLVLLQPVEGLLDALLGGLGGATEGGLLSGGLLDGALLGTGLGGNLTGGGLPLLSSPIGGTGIDALSGLGDLAGGGNSLGILLTGVVDLLDALLVSASGGVVTFGDALAGPIGNGTLGSGPLILLNTLDGTVLALNGPVTDQGTLLGGLLGPDGLVSGLLTREVVSSDPVVGGLLNGELLGGQGLVGGVVGGRLLGTDSLVGGLLVNLSDALF